MLKLNDISPKNVAAFNQKLKNVKSTLDTQIDKISEFTSTFEEELMNIESKLELLKNNLLNKGEVKDI